MSQWEKSKRMGWETLPFALITQINALNNIHKRFIPLKLYVCLSQTCNGRFLITLPIPMTIWEGNDDVDVGPPVPIVSKLGWRDLEKTATTRRTTIVLSKLPSENLRFRGWRRSSVHRRRCCFRDMPKKNHFLSVKQYSYVATSGSSFFGPTPAESSAELTTALTALWLSLGPFLASSSWRVYSAWTAWARLIYFAKSDIIQVETL